MPSVLVHGDMHMGNIMLAIDKGGNITNEIAAIVDWQTLHEDNLHELSKKYRKFSLNKDFYHYANKQSYIDLKMPSILVHGDMHMGNIMLAIDKGGNITNEIAAIVDWQTLHEGSPMSDLARFLVFCADGVVRRQAEAMALKYYYECLVKEFGNDPTKVPYTIEQLKKAYNFAFLTQAFFILADLDFFFGPISDRELNEGIKNAYYDYGVLKALHAYQDADRLLQGEMKEFFDKYGI
uniref:CHK kinase-like domain-containing protein n=1 Tax=Panagrolaimus sp. ES5 TaxID=591445 RepID=A0AC34G2E6_9BILA